VLRTRWSRDRAALSALGGAPCACRPRGATDDRSERAVAV